MSNKRTLEQISSNFSVESDEMFADLHDERHADLKDLSIMCRNLSLPPLIVGSFKYLKFLDLSHNSLTRDGWDMIPDLQNLTHLNISFNMLSEVPRGVCASKSITYLDVSNNQIDYHFWSGDLSNVHKLKYFDISHNYVFFIPDTFLSLAINLETLNMGYNGLSTDRKLSKFRFPDSLRVLNLENCSIGPSMPICVSRASNLRELNLADNKIDKIPKAFKNMTNLHTLNINNNRISYTADLFELPNLKVFSYTNNRIDSWGSQFDYNFILKIVNKFDHVDMCGLKYMRGQLTLRASTKVMSIPLMTWTRAKHKSASNVTKKVIKTVLILSLRDSEYRAKHCQLAYVPRDILYCIFEYLTMFPNCTISQ